MIGVQPKREYGAICCTTVLKPHRHRAPLCTMTTRRRVLDRLIRPPPPEVVEPADVTLQHP